MHRSLLAALVALSVTPHAEEWRYWTWTGEARMGAISGRTAWFATSGGVLEWNLDANTSRLYQKNDGLVSTDLISIVAQSDGSIWTVSEKGDLSVKRPDQNSWESRGTYSAKPSPWTFTPRAMAIHREGGTGREVLVMGGPKGLTFFPTDGTIALDWTDQFGSLGKREVRSISLSGDTLWVGLLGGLARIVPPWDSLGNNRAFIADPKRWTTLLRSPDSAAYVPYDALFPSSTGMTWQPMFTFASDGLLLSQEVLWWKGTAYTSTGIPDALGNSSISPVHALDIGSELLVSSSNSGVNVFSKGPMLLGADRTFRFPPRPANSFPGPPPPRIVADPEGRITSWGENRILSWNRGRNDWKQVGNSALFDSTLGIGSFLAVQAADMNTLATGPDHSVWVGFWGVGVWGARPLEPGSDSLVWKRWAASNSCLEPVRLGDAGLADYVTVNAIGSDASSVWGVLYNERENSDTTILFQAPTSVSDSLRCWKFEGAARVFHSGILIGSDKIWVASQKYLTILNRPTASSPVATRIRRRSGDFRRLTRLDLGGRSVVAAMSPGELQIIPEDRPDTTLASSIHQASPIAARQEWRSLALDGLGQIWAAGAEGIDILAVEQGASGWEMRKVREITTADGLPSNNVYSLAVDPKTGSVAVSTDAGIGFWASPYRSLPATLETKKARVWPNPLRTRSNRELVVDGATSTSEFYLLAADGSLVLHLGPEQQTGGYFRWAVPTPDQLRPGVYRWILKDGKKKVGGPLLIAE